MSTFIDDQYSDTSRLVGPLAHTVGDGSIVLKTMKH
jgi:hypothetical protein